MTVGGDTVRSIRRLPRVRRVFQLMAAGSIVVVRAAAGQGGSPDTGATRPARSVTVADAKPAADVGAGEWVRARSSAHITLRKPIALDLRLTTLGDALDAIGRQAGLRVIYGADVRHSTARVSIHATGMTVSDALTTALEGTRLEAFISLPGDAILIRRVDVVPAVLGRQQGGGTIAGRVVDAVTHAPLDHTSVRVEGPGLGAVSTADGRYAIPDVPAGTYHVAARRVGYLPITKDVTLTADEPATLDFALTAAPTRLNEMVTTAVGDQRRYEVGNVISTINADSITPTAPITSLTDLISARAPGVAVEETGGLTGSGEAIRIRGLSSLVLQGDPIVIIDGVRQDNTPGGAYIPVPIGLGGGASPSPSRLNDLDFSDVASIDVLKGPAASTEYGTDAANGVIVITTKHGTAGHPHWQGSAEETASAIPESFPTLYYRWGHTTDASHTAVQCPLVPYILLGSGYGSATGTCAVDSVTTWDPLNGGSQYSIFGTGSRQKYDLSVNGGSEAARYYIAGSVSNELGVLQMPGVFVPQAIALGLPHSAFRPNGEGQRSARANTAIRLGSTADLLVTGAYLSASQTVPKAVDLTFGVIASPALRDSANSYGYAGHGNSVFSPLFNFGLPTSQTTNRVTGGMTANWRPAPWFVGHGTVGIDHGSQQSSAAMLPQVTPLFYAPVSGQLQVGNATTDVYTVDLRGSATTALTSALRAVTSVGLQLADTRLQGTTALATGVTATNLTLNGAVNPTVTQLGNRQATLGGYAEEQLGLADRLFLTGALRIDAGSGFGHAYSTAAYPKASVSWLAVNTGPATMRLRGAFGESGVQPPNGSALQLYAPTSVYFGGAQVNAVQIANVQNQTLQPERSVEIEGGIDLGLWQNRLSVDLTGYSKTTHNALVSTGTGWDLGSLSYEENVGEVHNTGVEGTVTATVLRAQALTWDVTLNASINHNTLMTLAPGILSQQFQTYFGTTYQFAPGYPLYGYWAPAVQYADLNHDGVIEPNEVTIANSLSYAGSGLPTREASVGTHFALWDGAVSVGALVDYRGGFRLANVTAAVEADFGPQSDRASNDRSAPLWQQARDVAAETIFTSGLDGYAFPPGFYEDATYVRVRELSLTYVVPRTVVRALRLQQLSLTGAVRNLALWTRYTGTDPEVTNSSGFNTQLSPTSNTNMVNNNIRADAAAIPLLRYWVVRLNIGL